MEAEPDMVKMTLPEHGRALESVKNDLKELVLPETYSRNVRAFQGTTDVQELGKWAYDQFRCDNGFFSLYAPYMKKIEQEVLAMGVSLLHPEATSTGNFTSGGTESNFSAMKAAKMWAREKYPQIKTPNIVAPYTIHPSFKKGAVYLDMEIITTDLDENGRGIASNIADAINENTVMIAASAPSWHYSNIDPIPDIAKVATEAGLWMHVDGCVGGYISPFLEKLGAKLTPWDFRVPGVMSISADLHKYAYGQKPASTIYWRKQEYQKYHYVEIDDPFLGPYKMAGFSGSRTAGAIFSAWAVMSYLGEDGYLKLARRLLDIKDRFSNGINSIEGLRMWDVDVMPLHFSSEKAPLDVVFQGMVSRGWMLLGLVEPPAITICADPSWSDEEVDLFISDLRDSVSDALSGKATEKGEIRYG